MNIRLAILYFLYVSKGITCNNFHNEIFKIGILSLFDELSAPNDLVFYHIFNTKRNVLRSSQKCKETINVVALKNKEVHLPFVGCKMLIGKYFPMSMSSWDSNFTIGRDLTCNKSICRVFWTTTNSIGNLILNTEFKTHPEKDDLSLQCSLVFVQITE